MATHKNWKDLPHKNTPERREQIQREAIAELDRMGYAALRKARALTQVEMAERLSVSQANVAALESRSDLLLSTLAKYIRAMGGELEMRAVFPEATFNLEPLMPMEAQPKVTAAKSSQRPSSKRAVIHA